MIICRKGDRRQQNRKMCYYTQKTNRQPSGRVIRLTCVTTQFSKLLMWKHECDRQTNTIVHMLYRHNNVKTKGDGERERERERDTHMGDIVCMNVTDR